MKRVGDLKVFLISILVVSACGNVAPDSIEVASYPEIDTLLSNQVLLLEGNQLEKEVWLDGKSESKQFSPDSTGWAQELSFLKEINPNQSGYVGAFDESKEGSSLELQLQEGENGSLTYFSSIPTDNLLSIRATIHEDKDVYTHHKEVVVNFLNGKIKSYQVDGYQKIVLNDTIRFRIKGAIN